jgi:hypothetical protein
MGRAAGGEIKNVLKQILPDYLSHFRYFDEAGDDESPELQVKQYWFDSYLTPAKRVHAASPIESFGSIRESDYHFSGTTEAATYSLNP